MKRAAIVTAGIVALGLLAALCLPRHMPLSTASGPAIPANFHARIEYGMLILRGSLPNEASKAAILQRARELYGITPGSVVDELAVDPRMGSVSWADEISQVLPVLGYMTEQGSIIIDGHMIVVSGKVDGARTKATVLRDIAPLMQAGLELEDRIRTGPSSSSPTHKIPSPKLSLPSTRTLTATPPKAPPLRVIPSSASPPLAELTSASLQSKLNEILARASIEFESNTTTMPPRSLATLDKLIDQLRHAPSAAIEISGHTDKYGEPDYNVQLSRRRAEAVRRYFISHGLTNRFTTVGYGATRPLSAAENRAGLQRNRRIELRVKGNADL